MLPLLHSQCPSHTSTVVQIYKFLSRKTYSYLRKCHTFSDTTDPTIRLLSNLIHFHQSFSSFVYDECLRIWTPFNKLCMIKLYVDSQTLVIFLIPVLSAPYQNSSIWNKNVKIHCSHSCNTHFLCKTRGQMVYSVMQYKDFNMAFFTFIMSYSSNSTCVNVT